MFSEIRCLSCDRFEGYASGETVFRCQCGQLNIVTPEPNSGISKEQVLAQFKKFNSKNKSKTK